MYTTEHINTYKQSQTDTQTYKPRKICFDEMKPHPSRLIKHVINSNLIPGRQDGRQAAARGAGRQQAGLTFTSWSCGSVIKITQVESKQWLIKACVYRKISLTTQPIWFFFTG